MSANACLAVQSRNAALSLLSFAIFLMGGSPAEAKAEAGKLNVKMYLAQAQPRPAAASLQAELDALIKSAKAEGNLVVYSSSTENVNKRAGDGLEAKYGIKVTFVRAPSGTLMQRFAAEAEAGNLGGDVLSISGSTAGAYAEDGVKKGWIEPLSQANLPVLKSAEFPAVANRGTLAMIQAVPFQLAYNAERLKGADAPKSFQDLTNPKYKGQVILLDPRVADAYMEFYSVLLDRFGPNFLSLLRAQNPRFFTGGLPAVQALAAGEGVLATPMLVSTANILTAKGAALATVNDSPTAWVEQQVMLPTRAKSKHPNAARLFVNYVMSPEGNQVFNNEPGSTSIYSPSLLQSYKEQKPLPASRAAEIVKLLGL